MPMTSTCTPAELVQNLRASHANEKERDRLVLEHLSLVRAIAVRVYENLPVHVDLDDLSTRELWAFSMPP
jgi:DNA-directed RNA polymerase specialized sigma subunit